MQFDLPLPEASLADETPAGRRVIDVDVVRSPRRRSLALHVSALGRVEVRAPLWADTREVAAFLDRHRAWVLRKVADARANPPWEPEWGEGGHWFWRGESVQLAGGGARGGALADGVLALPLSAGHTARQWRMAVQAWHRRQAVPLLESRAQALFGEHCLPHRLKRIDLRWMRATWGTCAGRRGADGRRDVTLRLNLWLAALPPVLCDAILLHELAHVEHMNHGAGFYRRLAVLNPQWREHDVALKHWSRLLFPLAAR